MRLKEYFDLTGEKESFELVHENLSKGTDFVGTNVWILVFAIFIASLGLNVNSTAVIIGAMLISPLMGPIMGMGFSLAINDTALLRKSFLSYLMAALVSLATSCIYFLITPLNEAHSEILARTSPNIYDVLIAIFGGAAGMLATSSKLKGNVIPGVAIATALMPPMCTAGYGLATLHYEYFFGAFYLFMINTVFIALSTFWMGRIMKFPFAQRPTEAGNNRARRLIWFVAIITMIPSVYLGYDLVGQDRFATHAKRFVDMGTDIPKAFLLSSNVDARKRTITLVYGGMVPQDSIAMTLKARKDMFDLSDTELHIKVGLTSLQGGSKKEDALSLALNEKIRQLSAAHKKLDSMTQQQKLGQQLRTELKAQHDDLVAFGCQLAVLYDEKSTRPGWLVYATFTHRKSKSEQAVMRKWLQARLGSEAVELQVSEGD